MRAKLAECSEVGLRMENEGFDRELRYNAVCFPKGHVFQIAVGSDLERRAKEWEGQGYVSALQISSKECPTCDSDKLFVSELELQLIDTLALWEMM